MLCYLNKAEVNFLRAAKLSRQDYLDYFKKEANSGDMAVLAIRFGYLFGKVVENWSCYRRYAATKLVFGFWSTLQLHQERIQVVRSNKKSAETRSNSTALPQWTLDLKTNAYADIKTKEEQSKTHIQKHATCMGCVLLCFIINRYWGIVTVPGSIPCGCRPGVAGTSPCTLTMSLAIPVPSSSSSNGPSNYSVDNHGLVPWRGVTVGLTRIFTTFPFASFTKQFQRMPNGEDAATPTPPLRSHSSGYLPTVTPRAGSYTRV